MNKKKKVIIISCLIFVLAILVTVVLIVQHNVRARHPFCNVEFVDGGVGVFDSVPLRPLTSAEFERVNEFLQSLELRLANAEEDYYGGLFPCVQLRDADGVEYLIYCNDIRGDGVYLLYCTQYIRDGDKIVNTERDKYYIDGADMQVFIAMCREMLDEE
ncbi:MAG: hypothetical protein E7590_05880 [Ruminococcaceae bacterium]|nr:hypothetical protein [Oscillospiraceae bacterium]